jgi:hypothetical protein
MNEDTNRSEVIDFQSHACGWCPLVESSYLANFDSAEQTRWQQKEVTGQ